MVGFGRRVGGFGVEADRRGHGCCVGASAAAVEDGGQGRGWCWSLSDGGMELLICFHFFFPDHEFVATLHTAISKGPQF